MNSKMDNSNPPVEEVANAVNEITVNAQNKFSGALKNAVNMVIKKFLSKTNYSVFKKFYPDIALENSAFLEDAHRQLVSQLEVNFIEDLENFFTEQDIDKKLFELDLLTKNEKIDEQISWRPSGNPNEDIRDHRCKSKLKHLQSLKIFLQHLQEKNDLLKKEMYKNHEEILSTKKRAFDIEAQVQTTLKSLTETQLSMMEELLPLAEEIQK